MTCLEFEKIITDLARDSATHEIRSGHGEAHAEACARCAARLSEERALLAGVRLVVAEISREEAPPRLENALLLAFREGATASFNAPCNRGMRDGNRSRWIWGLAAAAVLLLVSAIVFSWQHPGSIDGNKRSNNSSSPQAPNPESGPPTPAIDSSKRIASAPVPQRRKLSRQPSSNEVEIATDFVPLLDGDDFDSLESNQLVRVELPGSALAAVGLPVDDEMANEPIKADVLLGHDGLARAIRFVR